MHLLTTPLFLIGKNVLIGIKLGLSSDLTCLLDQRLLTLPPGRPEPPPWF